MSGSRMTPARVTQGATSLSSSSHFPLMPSSRILFGDRVMPSLSHLLLNFLELRPHAVASGFPFDLELSAAACSADEGEAQKVEGLRFSEPPMSAALHCEAAELDQTGLLRME